MKIVLSFGGKLLGIIEDVDLLGPIMQVRVRIGIMQLLKGGIRVFMDEIGKDIMFLLRYEWFLDFCCRCGIIGNSPSECVNEVVDEDGRIGIKQYGDWLKPITPGPRRKEC